MARGINKVILVARLGKDPESRFMPSGKCVCSFSVATSMQWTDKNSGEKREETEWHQITAFGRLGEICAEYLSKGSNVYIEGRLKTENYDDAQGIKRYVTKIIANEIQMLDSKPEGQGQQQPRQGASAQQYQNATGGNSQNTGGYTPNNYGGFDDSDVPF